MWQTMFVGECKSTSIFSYRWKEYEYLEIGGTVKSAYKELAYKELPVIRNWSSFPNLNQWTSLLNI